MQISFFISKVDKKYEMSKLLISRKLLFEIMISTLPEFEN